MEDVVNLSDADRSVFSREIGQRTVELAVGNVEVARTTQDSPNRFVRCGTGLALFVKDNTKKGYFILVIDFFQERVVVEERVTHGMCYARHDEMTGSHTIRIENSEYLIGLIFGNITKAQRFYRAVTQRIAYLIKKMQPQRRQPAIKNIPPAATPANQEDRSKERKRKLTTNHREILNNMPQNEPPNLSDKISSSDYCQSSSKTFCIRKKSAAQRTKTFNGNHLQINGSPEIQISSTGFENCVAPNFQPIPTGEYNDIRNRNLNQTMKELFINETQNNENPVTNVPMLQPQPHAPPLVPFRDRRPPLHFQGESLQERQFRPLFKSTRQLTSSTINNEYSPQISAQIRSLLPVETSLSLQPQTQQLIPLQPPPQLPSSSSPPPPPPPPPQLHSQFSLPSSQPSFRCFEDLSAFPPPPSSLTDDQETSNSPSMHSSYIPVTSDPLSPVSPSIIFSSDSSALPHTSHGAHMFTHSHINAKHHVTTQRTKSSDMPKSSHEDLLSNLVTDNPLARLRKVSAPQQSRASSGDDIMAALGKALDARKTFIQPVYDTYEGEEDYWSDD